MCETNIKQLETFLFKASLEGYIKVKDQSHWIGVLRSGTSNS